MMTKCCSPIQTENQCLAMDSVSFCLWCPTHYSPNTNGEVIGQCMYSGDYININNNCQTNPDISSQCSIYSDCPTCSEDVVCEWCPSMGRCVTAILDDMEYPNDKYKCKGGRTKVCCDSYRDCSTCSYNSGQITTPICSWCQTTPQGEGKCLTHEKAVADVTCVAINDLGKNYCQEKCYLNGKDCKCCISQSGCIWLDEIEYIDIQEDLKPKIKQFCAVGGSKGPFLRRVRYGNAISIQSNKLQLFNMWNVRQSSQNIDNKFDMLRFSCNFNNLCYRFYIQESQIQQITERSSKKTNIRR
ncbi:Cysteine-rich_membrane protein 2 [Hexamita inflata]|uniref:Cysteine-rich membrane protein 2 n=1 Tax=Hexamita inflata TaxID=28002 RepID=A0AA86TF09_9EUKA|nr:Cysteine-rich membrane protein 2 [Hexamita inflata]